MKNEARLNTDPEFIAALEDLVARYYPYFSVTQPKPGGDILLSRVGEKAEAEARGAAFAAAFRGVMDTGKKGPRGGGWVV